MIVTIEGGYKAELPSAPVVCGLKWDEGWDIPTLWAITPDGLCYANDGHGGPLQDVPRHTLLSILRGHHQEAAARRALGIKPRLPEWVVVAIAQGWTPPSTFNRDDFE